jgi:gltX_bact: glutamyl-tRNA synthetase
VVADFNGFFAAFHSLFFASGTWTFSYDSLLITMYPPEFLDGDGDRVACGHRLVIYTGNRGRRPAAPPQARPLGAGLSTMNDEMQRILSMTNATGARVRVRFAPSPTGRLHVGGARTAIYNWAFARAMGGDFILRIEDTDPERSTEENVQVILNAMKWLGLDWDEGPEVGRPGRPYFQTQRTDTYAAALEQMKQRGSVYPCFCTKEELDAKRAAAEANEGGYAGYDRTCRDLDPAEAARRIEAGEPHVWRLRVPAERGAIEFDDAVYGHVSFPAEVMDDMIVVRTDGSPTYNFAVVCDDANMGVTHVIRGDDHLSNTPRQILIYEALGFAVPTFAHLSMILGPDGKKLSKRHGAARGGVRRARIPARRDGELPRASGLVARRRDDAHRPRHAVREVQPRPRDQEGRRVRRDEARLDERPVHQGDGRERVGARIAAVALARARGPRRRRRPVRGRAFARRGRPRRAPRMVLQTLPARGRTLGAPRRDTRQAGVPLLGP